MTLKELSRYRDLKRQLERSRKILASLISASEPGAQTLSDLPHAVSASDKVSRLAIEIADMRERISYLESECAEESWKLETYIGKIENPQTRLIFRLYFLHCMAWGNVAKTIGGGNTAASVKMRCYRQLGNWK